jgi:hypothetical protein
MIHPYSASWDRTLNRLLDLYSFDHITPYRAQLNGIKVWISNRPSAAFTPRIEGRTPFVRASRATIVRAMECLRKQPAFHEIENFDDMEYEDICEAGSTKGADHENPICKAD